MVRPIVIPAVVKIGYLALRTICKPIASRLKAAAGKHPRFRESIINIAQTNHRFTTHVQRRIYGRDTDVTIRPLDAEKAVHAAADLLGELFVFSVAGLVIIAEVQKSARSEARKEEKRKEELEAIKQKQENLERELESARRKMAELEHLAKARGLSGIFNLGSLKGSENAKPGPEVHSNTDGQSAAHAPTAEVPKSASPAHSTKDTKHSNTDRQSATHARTTEDPKSPTPAHSTKDTKQGASPS
ncbi:hypothetical protein MKW94_020045 [Papaver nudicaule]|uniref:OPA3-like protein n=1 Tax=Papaver nudicaule TaxID=74823 RepID=A0AA41VLB7_PAPNU|nr:hypothetical protein [Papaver nudicaule]